LTPTSGLTAPHLTTELCRSKRNL